MKKILLVTIVTLLGITISFAQGKGKKKGHTKNLTAEQRVEKQVNHLTKKLGLTDNQIPDVTAIVKTKVDQMMALKANGSGKKANKTDRKSIHSTFNTSLNNVLTTEQKEVYDALKAKKKAKRQARKGSKKVRDEEIDVFEE